MYTKFIEHKLTVDDLIVEYLKYKVVNGYQPHFSSSEFMDFLNFFEKEIKVEDCLYDAENLFKRFFDRKKYSTDVGIVCLRKDIKPCTNETDFVIQANKCFGGNDSTICNTFYISSDEKAEIFNRIKEYLKSQPKRKIDETENPNKNDLFIGKNYSAFITETLWLNHIRKQIENQEWPIQCTDIRKFLLETDLAANIRLESVKEDFLQIYKVIAKRIALLYKEDRKLEIITGDHIFLPRANYELMITDYEEIFNKTYNPFNNSMQIDVPNLSFTRNSITDRGFRRQNITTEQIKPIIRNRSRRLVASFDECIERSSKR